MVRDYSFFGSTADFVIKKEHLGFLPGEYSCKIELNSNNSLSE
jgi:hypothetical protein